MKTICILISSLIIIVSGQTLSSQINLKKIESYPIKDSVNFTYQFYIDFDGHMEDENVKRAFKDHKHEIIWLGSYVRDNNEI